MNEELQSYFNNINLNNQIIYDILDSHGRDIMVYDIDSKKKTGV